jgi:hypothetical protein
MKLKDVVKESWLTNDTTEETPAMTREDKSNILSMIAEYNKYAKAIYNEHDLIKIAKELSELAENAETLTISETEGGFDQITVKRNMKELKNLSGQFTKVAGEAQAFKQRMTGLYEDMGGIISRYFDITEAIDDAEEIDDAGEQAGRVKTVAATLANNSGVTSTDLRQNKNNHVERKKVDKYLKKI